MVISGHTYTQYADLEGFTGVPDHPENHENIGFLTSNTGPDLLKNQPDQHSMLDHHRPESKTPF